MGWISDILSGDWVDPTEEEQENNPGGPDQDD